MSVREPAVGDVLAGRYRLVAPLGRGGMGSVWRAEHLALRSPVAIKLIHGRVADAADAQARFLREAQAAAALRSPHVVQVLDSGVEEGVPFIAMELLEGESLADRLRRVGALSPAETARIVTHVARAIQKAHEAGIVHRDLKPDNVFLVHNADEEIAKVLDFGIAKTAEGFGEASAATRTGAVLGSPHYMSPEQARGTRAVDHRSDLWALGVIAFQCVTGRRPFDSEVLGDLLLRICTEPIPVPSRLAAVPAGFDAWFERATERDPDRRFQSAWEMSEALRAIAGLGQTSVASVSLPPPSVVPSMTVPAPRRARTPHGAIAVVLLALGLLGVGAVAIVLLVLRGMGTEEAPPAASAAAPAVEEPEEVASAAPVEDAPSSAVPTATARKSAARGKAAAAPSPAPASDDTGESGETGAKIKTAQDKVKAAEDKIKAAQEKLGGLGGQ